MASTAIAIGVAKDCFRRSRGKTGIICFLPGAVGAKGDITLPIPLDRRVPCPIVSITHSNETDAGVVKHNLVGTGTASDQIVYEAVAAHDTAGQFDIKSATVIRLNEATKAASILTIEGVWDV